MKRSILPLVVFWLALFTPLPCLGQDPPAVPPDTREHAQPRLDPHWPPLIARLAEDGMDTERMTQVFSDLPLPWSPAFMAAKVQELYGSRLGAGARLKALPDNELLRPPGYMPPTAGGFAGAKILLAEYAPLLADVHTRYGTPPSLIAAVLLLESDMGHELGESLALHALASMAATSTPEQALQGIEGYTPPSPALRKDMEKTIRERSARAYTELCALIRYCEAGGIDMLRLPGSVYGAIGLCQFMPGNISVYGVDSGKKGIIDLFGLPDAVHSIGNFLKEHGFSEKLSVQKQVEVLRRYNHSDSYAALALGLSYQLVGKQVPAELRIFAAGGARKTWWPKTRPAYRLPSLGAYKLH
jgi:membrane-bound lytic murein transglycosylase B